MKSTTATNARKNLFLLIKQASKPGASVAITHEGLPKVIMMSVEEFEGWQETMEIMSDRALVKEIRAAEKEKGTVTLESLETEVVARKQKK